jgi:hypothetical protein
MEIQIEGKFIKTRLHALGKGYGMYRRYGEITLSDDGITITGRHVKPIGIRWMYGIMIVFFSMIFTGGAIILGIIPVYLLVEYVILTKEDITIPWKKLALYAFEPRRKLIGLAFDGPKWTSPVIIRTEQLESIITELRSREPKKDATPSIAL